MYFFFSSLFQDYNWPMFFTTKLSSVLEIYFHKKISINKIIEQTLEVFRFPFFLIDNILLQITFFKFNFDFYFFQFI